MDFEFNEQQKLLKGAVERLVKAEVEPVLASYPEDRPLPKEAALRLMQILRPIGFLGARIPAEEGGSGLDHVSVGILYEVVPPAASMVAGSCDVIGLRICQGGSPRLKRKFLEPLLAGQIIAGSAISEPNVGSDPRGIETTAVLKGDHYVINGNKIWSSNSAIADILLAMVSTGRDERGRNILTRLVVERAVSPFQARDIETLGLRHHHLCEVSFQDCRVPAENVVGTPGDAHGVVTGTWLSQRVLMGIMAVHLAQKALDASIKYAKERRQFGKVIGSFQLIQAMIVDMYTQVETSRLLCYKALAMLDKGIWASKESSAAKYYATESAIKVISTAIEVHGAYGISQEYPLERLFRDARMLTFPDGTTEIQKLIVGRELLGIRAFV